MSSTIEQPIEKVESLKPKNRWKIGLAVVASAIVGAVAFKALQPQATTTPVVIPTPVIESAIALGRLEPQGEVIKVSAPSSAQGTGARVEKVLVKVGQLVMAGQILAILDNRDRTAADLDAVKQQVEVARANLAKVKAGAQIGEIQAQQATIARLQAQLSGENKANDATIARLQAELQGQNETLQATVARTEAERRNAQSDLQRYQDLYSSGAISAQELEQRRLSAVTTTEQVNESQATRRERVGILQQQLIEARANKERVIATLIQQINEAKATLNKITEVRPVDVQIAQAEVNSAISGVKQVQAQLALTYVTAPQTGEIMKIHSKPGENISNEGIVEMGRTDSMVVVAEVLEEDISKIRLGQKATVTSDNRAFNGEIKGTVTEIGRLVGKQDVIDSDPSADVDARVVEVKINLESQSSRKVSGLTNAKVVVAINI
ncbi:HlyD family efflux transporter periplasmic adaptor subunit [Synechocystis sp. PCC 7509]|uniref:HlyD family efflux transporter periplasmic adaptor subunit n=1 Tax=Synechocystis sp. PCC 7509 TaxID=927677 RepID=UPI0002AC20A5|nr:HlyD family efflux transporter periplasmic adaptor subunit [Synechocystis sp. PCC 7509]